MTVVVLKSKFGYIKKNVNPLKLAKELKDFLLKWIEIHSSMFFQYVSKYVFLKFLIVSWFTKF